MLGGLMAYINFLLSLYIMILLAMFCMCMNFKTMRSNLDDDNVFITFKL